jgi:hypothetical protein
MAAYKMFQATERVSIQFRAEGFNIFNHPQWNGVNQYQNSGNFLYPSGAHMGRVGQLAIRVAF